MTPWLDASNYALNPFAVQTFVAAFAILVLGQVILWREKWSTEGILFWLCTITIGIWLFSFSWMYSAIKEPIALFWAKTAYLGVPFIPSAFYHFSVGVLRTSARKRVFLGWTLSSFFAFTIISTEWLITGVYKYSWGYYPRYSWLSIPYLIFFFGMMAMTLRNYARESLRAEKNSLSSKRAKRLLVAFVIAYAGSVDYLAKFGIPVYPMGYLFVFFFIGFAARVIWRYRLVDITPEFAADQILKTMNEPLIACDLNGKIRIVNPAYTEMFGFGISELQGRHIRFLHGDGIWYQKMLSETNLQNHECVFLAKTGLKIFVSLSTSELTSPDGQRQGYVIIARDITERKQIERELQIFNQTLEDHVRQRTEELATKIQELEWLNTVMMGREERILELKEQIRLLEQQSKKPVEKEVLGGRVDSNAHH